MTVGSSAVETPPSSEIRDAAWLLQRVPGAAGAAGHRPALRAEPERDGWRVYDGDTSLCFCDNNPFFDIWQFAPGEGAICHNTQPPPAVRDMHTIHNTFLHLPFDSGKDLIAGVEAPRRRLIWRWEEPDDHEIKLILEAAFEEGQGLRYAFRVRFDPEAGRYRYFLEADVWKNAIEGMEPINMMMAGALASRPEHRRWTHSVWPDADGRLRRLVHSNALFTATDFATARRRRKNTLRHRPWIAYAAHSVFNPAIVIHETSAPVTFGTCSQLFDEHIVWHDGGQEDLEENLFHFRMATELVNLPADTAEALLAEAADPPRPAAWKNERYALPFHMDIENDLEEAVDPWEPEACPIFLLEKDAEDVAWVSDAARSGTKSIRLRGHGRSDRRVLHTGGAVCNVQPYSRYRLGGWVRTEECRRFARLEVFSYEYVTNNWIDIATSEKLGGDGGREDNEWTWIYAEIDTDQEHYVMPALMLYGPGTAWFDDLKLERIG